MTSEQRLAVLIMFHDLDMAADQIIRDFTEQNIPIQFKDILKALQINVKTVERANGNVFIKYDNKNLTLAEWSRLTGIHRETISKRLDKLGWSIEKALTTGAKVQTNNSSTYTTRDAQCRSLH
jgi:hypothetical protein